MKSFLNKFSPIPMKRLQIKIFIFFCSFGVLISWFVFPQVLNANIIVDFPFYALQNAINPQQRIDFLDFQNNFNAVAADFAGKFADIPDSFSSHYGDGQSLASHLASPIGAGAFRRSDIIPVGIGVGVALPKSGGIFTVSDSGRGVDSLPFDVLPSLGIGINTGFLIASNWDVRLSYFPISDIALPNVLQILMYRFRSSVVRVATNYRLFDQDRTIFGFGVTLGAYFTYTTGAVAFNIILPSIEKKVLGQPMQLAFENAQFNTKWVNYSGGAEIRFDYDLLFILPYLGFGLGLEYGRTDSVFQIDVTAMANNIMLGGSNINFVDESGQIFIFGNARTATVPFRIIVGFELDLYKLSIISEIQYFVNASILGVSFGVNLLI